MTRTDTERLDWFDRECARVRSRWNEGAECVEWDCWDGNWRPSFRAAIDAAMNNESP